MSTMKTKLFRLLFFVSLLVMAAIPSNAQSLLEFAETCDEASGQCAYWETLAPNSCEEPEPEELVCNEDNQESPERDDELLILLKTSR